MLTEAIKTIGSLTLIVSTDYQLAEYHGIRFVLPDMGYNLSSSNTILEWTGTINSLSSISEEAWAVDSKHFDQSSNTRSAELAVRCIGR